jgi:RimJ/RimL family protein N-acetyltransferase
VKPVCNSPNVQSITTQSAQNLNVEILTIRPLDELDRPALLAFGRALPYGDLLYLADDLPGWSRHVAGINLIVSAGWRRNGLGTALAQALVETGLDLQIDKLIVEIIETKRAGRAIFDRLGFQIEGQFSSHACDRQGRRHTLIVMARLCGSVRLER